MNHKNDKIPRNSKHKKHGCWERYYDNGDLRYKGTYDNGTEVGLWVVHELVIYPVIYKTTLFYYIR